jgi:predicted RNase H-like HicB family nuclease
LEFECYIEQKIRTVLDLNKKQGKRRDIKLLAAILNFLFWERFTPNRTLYDIQGRLINTYSDLKLDTLEDNLVDFLAKVPADEPFVKITSESSSIDIFDLGASIKPIYSERLNLNRKPRNVYTLNEYYLRDYFEKDIELTVKIAAHLVPTTEEDIKRLEAAGIVPCPSCGNPTHRSDLIRIRGEERDCCLNEYFESVKKCIHSARHEDGSWSETIVGISGMASEGDTRDKCRRLLMEKLMDWIRIKQRNGSAIPPIPKAQFREEMPK